MERLKVVVGTRGSKLAMRQCERVVSVLKQADPAKEYEIRIIKTHGDQDQNIPLSEAGGKGLFVKELEKALLSGDIDLAVHSMKDLPTEVPTGLKIGAVTEREDPRDVLISANNETIEELPPEAQLGTGSLRRTTQLLHFRRDLGFLPVRGNLDTRLQKLKEGKFHALVLAFAGVKRLERQQEITQLLPLEISLPAAGQGAVGIELRSGDEDMEVLASKVDDHFLHRSVLAERIFLERLGGGCHVPIGVMGEVKGGELYLRGCVTSLNGEIMLKEEGRSDIAHAEDAGISLAEALLSRGAADLLHEIERGNGE